jgi:amidase
VIILGKANMNQWAGFRSKSTNNGWSAHGGQTYGAYYPKQDACGSSSGSGVVSSIGLSFASIGTEVGRVPLFGARLIRNQKTDSSIVCPSSKSNLVGIKPTVGLTSRHLVILLSEHQDSIGPMARTVKDAAHILQAIAGIDPADNYTLAIPNKGTLPDYAAACRFSSLAGARIGVPWNAINKLAHVPTSFELREFVKAIPILKDAGAIIVDPVNFTGVDRFLNGSAEIGVAAADFPVNFLAYTSQLRENPQNITDLASLRSFTRTLPKEEYPDRDTIRWDKILDEHSWNNTDPRFWPAYQKFLQESREGGLLGALKREHLDAVILPSAIAPLWAGAVGTPIITVPLGSLPTNTSLRMDPRGDLVTEAPGIP